MASAHNLKAAGSNPAPATKKYNDYKTLKAELNARLLSLPKRVNNRSRKQDKLRPAQRVGSNHPVVAACPG
jgi:hypothetical protein